jgi:hypothetical protein
MKEKSKNPRKQIQVSISPEGYNKIYDLYAESICKSLNEYACKVLLKRPVVIKYRNQATDDLLAVMLEIKMHLAMAVKMLSKDNEPLKQELETKYEAVCLCMDKIYERCVRESKN